MTGSRAGSLSQRGPCGIRRDMSRVPAHPRVPRRPAEAPRGPGLTRQGSLSLRCTEAWPRLDQLPGLAPAHRGPGGGSCSARWEPLLLRNTGSVTQRHRVRGHSAGWCLGQTCSPGVRAEAQEWLPVEQLPRPELEEAGRGLHAPGGRQAHQDAGEALTGSRPQLPVTQTNARAPPPGKAHTLPGSRLTDAATRPQPRCPGLAVSRKARGDEAGGERLTVTRRCDLVHWQPVCERLLLAEGPEVVTGSPWPSRLHPAYTPPTRMAAAGLCAGPRGPAAATAVRGKESQEGGRPPPQGCGRRLAGRGGPRPAVN